MKLWLVECRGMTYSIAGSGNVHGRAYVIAEDPQAAYAKLRAYLDKKDLGFTHERELASVELIADASEYPSCGTQLFL